MCNNDKEVKKVNIAKIETEKPRKYITKNRDQINLIRNQESASFIDISELKQKSENRQMKLDKHGNVILDSHNREDKMWMDD